MLREGANELTASKRELEMDDFNDIPHAIQLADLLERIEQVDAMMARNQHDSFLIAQLNGRRIQFLGEFRALLAQHKITPEDLATCSAA